MFKNCITYKAEKTYKYKKIFFSLRLFHKSPSLFILVSLILINLFKIIFPEMTAPNKENIIIKIGVEINIQVGKYNLGKYLML